MSDLLAPKPSYVRRQRRGGELSPPDREWSRGPKRWWRVIWSSARNCFVFIIGGRCARRALTLKTTGSRLSIAGAVVLVALLKAHDLSRGAMTRADLAAACAGQHVMAAIVVPTHQVGLDGSLSQRYRHRIMNMVRRNVAVRLHLLQSFNQPVFMSVGHRDQRWRRRAIRSRTAARGRRTLLAQRSAADGGRPKSFGGRFTHVFAV